MNSVLISVKPKFARMIYSGKKIFEFRKKVPKENPKKYYIYESGTGCVTGFFIARPPAFYDYETEIKQIGNVYLIEYIDTLMGKNRYYFSAVSIHAPKSCKKGFWAIPIIAPMAFAWPVPIEQFEVIPPQNYCYIKTEVISERDKMGFID